MAKMKRRGATVGQPVQRQVSRKATFVLPGRMLDTIKQVVEAGLAASASELVRDAVSCRLQTLREQEIRRAFEDAAHDPLFMKDLSDSMTDFETIDSETARALPE